ncbi:MAG: hypothetical protein JWO60_3021, partial [Frankiales bacterium]|nr:hypothetical protein [Frankiales bacterium]
PRPWPAAAALALALTKPPFGLPLVVLLLLQGRWRVVLRGVGLLAAVSAPVLVALLVATDGPRRLVEDLRANLAYTNGSVPDQVGGVRRIDLASLLARGLPDAVPGPVLELGAAALVLGAAAVLLHRARRTGAHPGVEAVLAAGAVVLSVPHQTYDLLLLAAPLCAVAVAARSLLPLAVPGLLLLGAAALPAGVLLRALGRPGELGTVTSTTSAAALLLLLAAAAVVGRSPAGRAAPV